METNCCLNTRETFCSQQSRVMDTFAFWVPGGRLSRRIYTVSQRATDAARGPWSGTKCTARTIPFGAGSCGSVWLEGVANVCAVSLQAAAPPFCCRGLTHSLYFSIFISLSLLWLAITRSAVTSQRLVLAFTEALVISRMPQTVSCSASANS